MSEILLDQRIYVNHGLSVPLWCWVKVGVMIHKPKRTQFDFQSFHGWQTVKKKSFYSCSEYIWWKDSKWIILECCICRTGQGSWKYSYLTSTMLFTHVKWCVRAYVLGTLGFGSRTSTAPYDMTMLLQTYHRWGCFPYRIKNKKNSARGRYLAV